MAINVNTVYQTVLFILNKEQRGYVTPAEFNSLAVQVQDEIFQSYLPDGNQVNRQNQNNTQNDTEFFNIFKNISYKIAPFIDEVTFEKTATGSSVFYYPVSNDLGVSNRSIYNIGEVISTYTGDVTYNSVTQLVDKSDYNKITRSKLTQPTKQYPIFFTSSPYSITLQTSGNLLNISPTPDSVTANILFQPSTPFWRFVSGTNRSYVYDSSNSVNFELEISEQSNVIIRILKYCGVIINDPTIIQAASQDIQQTTINEKS